MDDEAVAADVPDSYTKAIHIGARIDAVFERVATLDGIKAWWEGSVTGNASEEGGLRFSLPDSDDYTEMKVDSVVVPNDVAWSVLEDSGYGGEWMGTVIHFHLDEDLDGSCVLTLHHEGLTPALDCFMDCRTGWDRHLDRIRQSAEGDGE
jgi:activator of Hsp90 ATPase-like protein